MSNDQLYAFQVSSKNQDPAQRAASLHTAMSCPSFSQSRNQGHNTDGRRGIAPHLPNKRSHDHITYSMQTFDDGVPSSPTKEDKNGHTRLRASQACETCRVRKRKCSGQKPTCGRCSERGLKCVWSDIVPHRQPKPRLRRVPALASLRPVPASDASSSDGGISPATPVGDNLTYDPVRASEGPNRFIVPSQSHASFAGPVPTAPMEPSHLEPAPVDSASSYDMQIDPQIKREPLDSVVLPSSSAPYLPPPAFGYDGFEPFELPCPSAKSSNGDLYASYASSMSDGSSSFTFIPFPQQEGAKHISQSSLPSSISAPMAEYINGVPSWMEILDPVIGSFLNPTPMIDPSCNPIPAWEQMLQQDVPPDFGFVGAVMPAESPYHVNPRGSFQW